MERRKIAGAIAGLLLIAGGITGGVVGAGGGDDNEVPISGPDLERASEAALGHTGGGRVTETEVGDEEGAYEVEVTLGDGSQVDVHLDINFNVIGSEADGLDDAESDDADD